MQAAGTGVILITHDWGVVADLCQRAVVMYAGQIVEEADVIKLVREPAHPYTKSLLRADPHHSAPGHTLPALEGSVPAPTQWPVGCHFQNRCPMRTDSCAAAPIPITVIQPEHRQTRCIRHPELTAGGVK
jgi:peptide/nickel transport system permease protein